MPSPHTPLLLHLHSRTPPPSRHLPRSASSSRQLSTHAPTLSRKPEQPEEPNVYKHGEPSILLTDRAIKQLTRIAARDPENAGRMAFRIAVEPGGCHGYQYKMELEEADAEEGQETAGEEDDL